MLDGVTQVTECNRLSPAFRAKFEMFAQLEERELAHLSQLFSHRVRLQPHSDLVVEGANVNTVYLLESGWGIRYKLLSDGRRQILNFVLPGDFVGLRASLFGIQDQTVELITAAIAATVPSARIMDLFRSHPKLAAAVSWSSAREEAMMADHIVRLGRRNAYERMAHLLLELLRRLQAVGLAGDRGFDLPATQETLGDFLGLSVVHVNRTLRRLREEMLIAQENGRVRLLDIPRLEAIADFESPHLDRRLTPRKTQVRLDAIEAEAGRPSEHLAGA